MRSRRFRSQATTPIVACSFLTSTTTRLEVVNDIELRLINYS